MKHFAAIVAGSALLFALAAPLLKIPVSPLGKAGLAALLVVLAAVFVGLSWHTDIKRSVLQKATETTPDSIIEAILKENNLWLQAARPIGASTAQRAGADQGAIRAELERRYFSSFLLVLGVTPLAVLALVSGGEVNDTTGVFGSLLKTPFGKCAASAIVAYISLSALSFFTLGALTKLNSRESE